jgi:hypothetical protein
MDQIAPTIDRGNEESARAVFLAWEKLRLAYNAILVGVVLAVFGCLFGWSVLAQEEVWEYLVAGAFLANVCFCVGPWAEGWLAVAGARRKDVRSALFVLGTLLACGLCCLALYSWHTRGWPGT